MKGVKKVEAEKGGGQRTRLPINAAAVEEAKRRVGEIGCGSRYKNDLGGLLHSVFFGRVR